MFTIIKAVRHGRHVNIFKVNPWVELWWEHCNKLTALLDGKKVTIKGRSYGTSNGNFLFIDDKTGVCYTLYGHHLYADPIWN